MSLINLLFQLDALEILDAEIVPNPELIAHNGSTVAFHKDLALTLFYKVEINLNINLTLKYKEICMKESN